MPSRTKTSSFGLVKPTFWKKRDVNETHIAVSVSHRLESIQRRERYHHQEIQSRRQEDTRGMFSRGTSFRAWRIKRTRRRRNGRSVFWPFVRVARRIRPTLDFVGKRRTEEEESEETRWAKTGDVFGYRRGGEESSVNREVLPVQTEKTSPVHRYWVRARV